jgi:hypothetical protein
MEGHTNTDYGYGSNAELAPKFSVKTKVTGSVGGGMGSIASN